MSAALHDMAIGTIGAILQELLFWYNAKAKLDTAEYGAILKSLRYWSVVIAMCVGSGIASYFWFSPEQQTARTYLLFGAAFPVLFKKAVDAFISAGPTQLGTAGGQKVLTEYFKAA
jgi:hypothetical protein